MVGDVPAKLDIHGREITHVWLLGTGVSLKDQSDTGCVCIHSPVNAIVCLVNGPTSLDGEDSSVSRFN